MAQGGNFLEGFAGSAISAFGSVLVGGTDYSNGLIGTSGDGNVQGMVARTSIVAAVGYVGAVLSGGKCGNGAITAAFASLFNAETKKNQAQLNKAHHDKIVSERVAFWRSQGFHVKEQVTFKDPSTGKSAIVDFVVSTLGGALGIVRPNPMFAVDVKTGKGGLSDNQK